MSAYIPKRQIPQGAEICRLKAAGVSDPVIAEETGTSRSTVHRALVQAGIRKGGKR